MTVQTIEIDKSVDYVSDQISLYQEMLAVGKTVARPTYSKDDLLNAFGNSTNRRCIEAKANVIAGLGYTWKDEENAIASGVVAFNDNIYGKDGSPKPFSKLLKEWLVDKGIFGESRLEICRIGKTPENLVVLSGRNTLTSIDRKSIWQLDRQRGKAIEFRRYGQGTKTAHDTLCITDASPEDDYYGVPCYVPALTSIQSDKKIKTANSKSLDNIIDPSFVIIVTGYTVTNDEIEEVKGVLQNIKSNRSSSAMLNFGNKDAVVNVQNFGVKAIDGSYIEERNAISLEILSLHGLTPELFGVLQNGGISSGEKATGAMKIFFQTTIRPEQEMLQKLLNEFYKTEFPLFNKDNGIVFNSIDLTDSSEDATTELTEAQTAQAYVTLGSLQLYNEYRETKGLVAITDVEWSNMLAGGTGQSFEINKQQAFNE